MSKAKPYSRESQHTQSSFFQILVASRGTGLDVLSHLGRKVLETIPNAETITFFLRIMYITKPAEPMRKLKNTASKGKTHWKNASISSCIRTLMTTTLRLLSLLLRYILMTRLNAPTAAEATLCKLLTVPIYRFRHTANGRMYYCESLQAFGDQFCIIEERVH